MKQIITLIAVLSFGVVNGQTTDIHCEPFEIDGGNTAGKTISELSFQNINVSSIHESQSFGAMFWGPVNCDGTASSSLLCGNTTTGGLKFTNQGNTNKQRNNRPL